MTTSQTQSKDAAGVSLAGRVKTFLSRFRPRIPLVGGYGSSRKQANTQSSTVTTVGSAKATTAVSTEEATAALSNPTNTELGLTPASSPTTTTTTTTTDTTTTNTETTVDPTSSEGEEVEAPLTASKTNPTLVSKPRKFQVRSNKIHALDVLPKGIYISHVSTKPYDRHCKVFHVDPKSLPLLPLRSRRSITNFQYSRLITEKEAQTECRGLREIKARDADKYTRLGFDVTGQFLVVDSRFLGEVARTTVGWIRVERGFEYWQYLTDKDEEMIEIMRYKIWSPGTEVCKTFLRDEEVMCCRKRKLMIE